MAVDPVSLAITVALDAAQMALAASRRTEGPRLTDLSASVADYGTPLNYIYGDRRLECPCFYCEPITETKHTTKSKTGKYGEYKYFGTFAILVNDGSVVAYTRIWFDRHLVYGTGGAGEVITNPTDGSTLIDYMRQYFGSPTQGPDPRMVATITANEGPNLCPSYLDLSYLFFEDLPLEQLGNRFPQVSVEVDAGPAQVPDYAVLSDSGDPFSDPEPELYYGALLASSPNGQFVVGSDFAYFQHWLVDVSVHDAPALVYADDWNDYEYSDPIDPDPIFDHFGFVAIAVDDQGSLWGEDGSAGARLMEVPNDGTHKPIVRYWWDDLGGGAEGGYVGQVWTFTMPDASIFIVLKTGLAYSNLFWTGTKGVPGLLTQHTLPFGRSICFAFQDEVGDVWIAADKVDEDNVRLDRLTNVGTSPYPASQTFPMPPIPAGVYPRGFNGYFADGFLIGGWLGNDISSSTGICHWLVKIPLAGGAVLSVDIGYCVTFPTFDLRDGPQTRPNPDHYFVIGPPDDADGRNFLELKSDLTFDLAVNLNTWGAGPNVYTRYWVDGAGGFVGTQFEDDTPSFGLRQSDLFVFYLAPRSLTLGYICSDVARRANMDAADYDFSQLDQPIHGYSWSIGQGRDIISHLLDIHDSDIYPHGFILDGRKRGDTEDDGALIDTPFFVRERGQEPNSAQSPLYKITMTSDSDLPRRAFMTFADWTAEQQPNSAVAQRTFSATQTVRELAVDVTTLALSPDEAQPLVERWLRRRHIGAVNFGFVACPREISLEPADLRICNFDGEMLRGRLMSMTYRADRSIATEWEQDSAVAVPPTPLAPPAPAAAGNPATITAAQSAPGVGAIALGRPTPVVYNPAPSRAFLLDIPLVSDADDQTTPFAYLTAGRLGRAGTFPGSDFQHSDTDAAGTYEAGWDAILSSNEATWGTCEDVLGDALPWIPDRANSIIVHIANGLTLESRTDAYLGANPTANLAAIGTHAGGWEIVQFGEAAVVSTGRWRISNFYRRGVKGTESLIGTHGADELFVLLRRLTKHDMGAGEIGDTDYYRSVTIGNNPDTADTISVDYVDQPHRPLSPVHVELERDIGTGDWSGSWTRRTRVGGGSVNGQDVPLGEASEAYRVKIIDGAVVKRTINVTDPTFTYASADQVTDWGSGQTTLDILVCQMDPTLSIEGAATSASA